MPLEPQDIEQRREAAASLVNVARAFVADVVQPVAAALDRHVDPQDCFSWDIVEEGSRRGLRTLTLLPEYGGAGADCVTTALVVEEIAKGDMGVAVVFAQTLKLIQSLQAAATAEQRTRFLPMLRDDPRALMAIGMTEPQTASNYIIPYAAAGFVTRATRAGDGWVLNGRKRFISNGSVADLVFVYARDPGSKRHEGLSCFAVPKGTPGFTVTKVETTTKLGLRASPTADLAFEDCRVPEANLVGKRGNGWDQAMRTLNSGRLGIAAGAVGVARAALEAATKYVQERKAFGRLIGDFQLIREMIAESATEIDRKSVV